MAVYDPGAGAFAQLMAQAPQFQAGPGTFTQAAIQNAANRLSIAGDAVDAAALIEGERIRRKGSIKQARILRRPEQTTIGDRLRSLLASGALAPGVAGAVAGGGGGASRMAGALNPLQLLEQNNQTVEQLRRLYANAQGFTVGSGNLAAGAIGDVMGG